LFYPDDSQITSRIGILPWNWDVRIAPQTDGMKNEIQGCSCQAKSDNKGCNPLCEWLGGNIILTQQSTFFEH